MTPRLTIALCVVMTTNAYGQEASKTPTQSPALNCSLSVEPITPIGATKQAPATGVGTKKNEPSDCPGTRKAKLACRVVHHVDHAIEVALAAYDLYRHTRPTDPREGGDCK